jgi:3-phenylpropionate/cinnamic acid dioxygenase small subunit
MDPTLQILLDRQEIDDLLTGYAHAVDDRDWDRLGSVFSPDAQLDYRSAGGIRGEFPEVRQWLSEVVPLFTWTQHQVVNRTVTVDPDGETARARSDFHNPNEMMIEGEPWLFVVGGRYHDHLRRLPVGWRITRRVEETLWWHHPMPGLPPTPYPLPDDALG